VVRAQSMRCRRRTCQPPSFPIVPISKLGLFFVAPPFFFFFFLAWRAPNVMADDWEDGEVTDVPSAPLPPAPSPAVGGGGLLGCQPSAVSQAHVAPARRHIPKPSARSDQPPSRSRSPGRAWQNRLPQHYERQPREFEDAPRSESGPPRRDWLHEQQYHRDGGSIDESRAARSRSEQLGHGGPRWPPGARPAATAHSGVGLWQAESRGGAALPTTEAVVVAGLPVTALGGAGGGSWPRQAQHGPDHSGWQTWQHQDPMPPHQQQRGPAHDARFVDQRARKGRPVTAT